MTKKEFNISEYNKKFKEFIKCRDELKVPHINNHDLDTVEQIVYKDALAVELIAIALKHIVELKIKYGEIKTND